MAYYAGMALYKNEILLPSGEIYFFTFLVLLIIIAVYPGRKKQSFQKTWFTSNKKPVILFYHSFLF